VNHNSQLHPFIKDEQEQWREITIFSDRLNKLLIKKEQMLQEWLTAEAKVLYPQMAIPKVNKELLTYYAPYIIGAHSPMHSGKRFSIYCDIVHGKTMFAGVKVEPCYECPYSTMMTHAVKTSLCCDAIAIRDEVVASKQKKGTSSAKRKYEQHLAQFHKHFSILSRDITAFNNSLIVIGGENNLSHIINTINRQDFTSFGFGRIVPENHEDLIYFRSIYGGWNENTLYGWISKKEAPAFKKLYGNRIMFTGKGHLKRKLNRDDYLVANIDVFNRMFPNNWDDEELNNIFTRGKDKEGYPTIRYVEQSTWDIASQAIQSKVGISYNANLLQQLESDISDNGDEVSVFAYDDGTQDLIVDVCQLQAVIYK
jgi:hypothetical protein